VDEIRLTVPRRRDYFPVARLVVSGVGSRLELTLDGMEDLELALDALFDRAEEGDELTLEIRVAEGGLETVVGPFGAAVRDELASGGEGMTLGRILGTLVDDVSIGERGGHQWVTLTKRVA
jgi:anti-sigma regulatory factor (Ser/Thr protein kinase)